MRNMPDIKDGEFRAYHHTPGTIAFYKTREITLATPLPIASLHERACLMIKRTFVRLRSAQHY